MSLATTSVGMWSLTWSNYRCGLCGCTTVVGGVMGHGGVLQWWVWQCFRLLPSRIVGVVIAKVINDCCHVWEYCHGGHGHMQVFCYGGCGNVLECCQMKF